MRSWLWWCRVRLDGGKSEETQGPARSQPNDSGKKAQLRSECSELF